MVFRHLIIESMRLLCADDEEDVRTILELALGLDPSIHAEIVDGGEALLDRSREGWDAFVIDGMMPGMDGLEVCRRLRAQPETARTPIIVLSGRTQREDITRAASAGANATLPKPFDPLTLAAELRKLIG
jgi:CheY-like chemotaxis protein